MRWTMERVWVSRCRWWLKVPSRETPIWLWLFRIIHKCHNLSYFRNPRIKYKRKNRCINRFKMFKTKITCYLTLHHKPTKACNHLNNFIMTTVITTPQWISSRNQRNNPSYLSIARRKNGSNVYEVHWYLI
jgi:hypothetical protein